MKTFSNYYNNNTEQSIVKHHYKKESDWKAIIDLELGRYLEVDLSSALAEYNQNITSCKLIEKAQKKNTLFVFTGQQPGVFGGPVYNLYKILGAALLARKLEAKYHVDVCPVFWLQSHDNRAEQINSIKYLDTSNTSIEHKLEFNEPDTTPYFGRRFPDEIDDLKSTIKKVLGGFGKGEEIEGLLADYSGNISKSFASFYSKMLGEYQILFFDPASYEPIKAYKKVFEKRKEFFDALSRGGKQLKKLDIEVAIEVPQDSAEVLMVKDENGYPRRHRVVESESGLLVGGESFSEGSIYDLFFDKARVSSSALSRPIIQSIGFRCIGNIVGPSEINYHAQLPFVYNAFELNQPILVPRPSFRVIPAKKLEKLQSYGLGLEDLQKSDDELKTPHDSDFISPDKLKVEFDQTLSDLKTRVQNFLPKEEEKKLDKTFNKLDGIITGYVKNYKSSTLKTNREFYDLISGLRNLLDPPQDRNISTLYFFARYGYSFIEKVAECVKSQEDFDSSFDLEI